mgnify:FL=1
MGSAALGAIDVDSGSTPQQRALLGALVDHLWKRPDLDLGTLEPISPSQIDRINEYAVALASVLLGVRLRGAWICWSQPQQQAANPLLFPST